MQRNHLRQSKKIALSCHKVLDHFYALMVL